MIWAGALQRRLCKRRRSWMVSGTVMPKNVWRLARPTFKAPIGIRATPQAEPQRCISPRPVNFPNSVNSVVRCFSLADLQSQRFVFRQNPVLAHKCEIFSHCGPDEQPVKRVFVARDNGKTMEGSDGRSLEIEQMPTFARHEVRHVLRRGSFDLEFSQREFQADFPEGNG